MPTLDIPHVAGLLGIDAVNEPQYMWIAKMASMSKIDPAEWKEFTDERGCTMYYNLKLKKILGIHPTIALYSRVYQKHKGFTESNVLRGIVARTEAGDKFETIIRLIKERQARHQSGGTPEIVMQLAMLLHVEVKSEFALLRCIKATMEAYIARQFDLTHFLDDIQVPLNTLRAIIKQQVKEDIVRRPESIIMCQECEKRSSVIKCEQCMDHFCQECFDVLHATGNRKTHLIQEVEQLVCVACDTAVADCQCIQCGTFFCGQCYLSIHSARPDLHKHRKRNISGLVCQECEHAHAAVLCEDCLDLFCSPCYLRIHRNGQRRQHSHLTVDPNGQVFRAGLLVSPSEAQSLIDRARSTAVSGPWIHYSDLNSTGYWFNCVTEDVSETNPVLLY